MLKHRKCDDKIKFVVFEGRSFTGPGEAVGEIVFNTSMSGYQEILTDPSYTGQIVTMTYPLIGNYGVNPEDMESAGVHPKAFLVKEYVFGFQVSALSRVERPRSTAADQGWSALPHFFVAGTGLAGRKARVWGEPGSAVTLRSLTR